MGRSVSPYAIFAAGVSTGLCLAWSLSWICYSLTEKERVLRERLKKAEFDAEILSRWLQLGVIERDAKVRGYHFVDPRARS